MNKSTFRKRCEMVFFWMLQFFVSKFATSWHLFNICCLSLLLYAKRFILNKLYRILRREKLSSRIKKKNHYHLWPSGALKSETNMNKSFLQKSFYTDRHTKPSWCILMKCFNSIYHAKRFTYNCQMFTSNFCLNSINNHLFGCTGQQRKQNKKRARN